MRCYGVTRNGALPLICFSLRGFTCVNLGFTVVFTHAAWFLQLFRIKMKFNLLVWLLFGLSGTLRLMHFSYYLPKSLVFFILQDSSWGYPLIVCVPINYHLNLQRYREAILFKGQLSLPQFGKTMRTLHSLAALFRGGRTLSWMVWSQCLLRGVYPLLILFYY
jgi:hypothetical protein